MHARRRRLLARQRTSPHRDSSGATPGSRGVGPGVLMGRGIDHASHTVTSIWRHNHLQAIIAIAASVYLAKLMGRKRSLGERV